ncbi:beta-hexosaminidase-like [Mercenaria mercenaria]|uniref:beta-hexosaminidase-like n=1 Tax=Mercenaria mercenaria TaxID=6596 RepID=UPI00234EE5BC|nr:beta-hexosaminidase-like [Mercenaria mercenaria]
MEGLHIVAGIFIILLGKGSVVPTAATDQRVIDYIAENLDIEVAVVDNLHKYEDHVPVDVYFHNNGNRSIPAGSWKIYFYNLYGVKAEDLACGLRVEIINGGLFSFMPKHNGFTGIAPSTVLKCTFYNKYWTVAKTDFFLNWYVSSPGNSPRIIESTREEGAFVRDFDTPAKWKRSKEDQYNPFSPEQQYQMNEGNHTWSHLHRIVPKPLTILEYKHKTLHFDRKLWKIIDSKDFHFEARYLSDKLQVQLVQLRTKTRYIEIIKGNTGDVDPEAYTLNVHPDSLSISITASAPQGALHGVQSLISLIEGYAGPLPSIFIIDKPRFSYRGILLDTSRNFKPKSWIYRFLDVMSMYKLNKLHFHLSNDEGWRIEIPTIPELTQIGGKRCHSDFPGECLIPQLGSGPYSNNTGSGFYSVQDYRDILAYANSRHIEVIPEIDIPAHSYAAITAMNTREAKINNMKTQGIVNIPESYLLSDQSGPSNIFSAQRWMRNAINPCLNTTYRFIEVVIDTFIALHKPVQPLRTFHIGGDEVPEGVWNDSIACQKYLSNSNTNTSTLQKMFTKRVADIMASKGLDLAVVGESVYGKRPTPKSFFKNSNVFVYRWDTRGEILNTPADFVDEGYKVVLMPATHVYFDITQAPDPEERGLFWSTRYIDEKKVFGFMPDSLLANINTDPMGNPINKVQMCSHNTCSNQSTLQNVIGMQACFWAELMRNEADFHYMAFPRILALAERAWHKASWEDINDIKQRDMQKEDDWNEFVETLGYKELPRLENRGIHYRIPPPGAKLDGCMLKANNMYPNHILETSLDNGRSWVPFCDMMLQSGTLFVKVRSKSVILQRVSRQIEFQVTVNEKSLPKDYKDLLRPNRCLKTVILKSNHGYTKSSSQCYTNCKTC